MYLLHGIEKDLVNHLNQLLNMRMLFNHGLSADEIFTNTPDRITTKTRQWFKDNYGDNSSREDGISTPFRYCMGVILNKILDEKLRFKIPVSNKAYIDFEVIHEDLFELYKQRGAFPDIDFIESDFTGYYLRYYYQAKHYQKKVTVYLGGDLKKKLINKINSGEKLYTTKDFTLDDILNDVHQQFKELDKRELKQILLHGFRRMHSAIMYGCYVSIATTRYINCYAFFGLLSTNPIEQANIYTFRKVKKLRKIDIWKRTLFDNYYYIGLTPSLLEKWVDVNKGNRVFTTFEKITPLRLLEEVCIKAQKFYIFRFKVKKWRGYMFWEDKIKIRDVEYIGESNKGVFSKTDKSWQQLIKDEMKNKNIKNE